MVRAAADAPHFVAEVFFLTQRLVHVALIPAINRFANMCTMLEKMKPRSNEVSPGRVECDDIILSVLCVSQFFLVVKLLSKGLAEGSWSVFNLKS